MQTRANKIEIIKEILLNYGVEQDITENTCFLSELDLNSLDFMNIINDVEEQFEIDVPDSIISKLNTVKDVIDCTECAQYRNKEFGNVRELLEFQRECLSDANAVLDWQRDDKCTVTYKSLYNQVMCLGAALYDRGIKNKKVAVMGENSFEYMLLILSCISGSNTVIPLDFLLPVCELNQIISDSDAEVLFYDEGCRDSALALDNVSVRISLQTVKELIAKGEKLPLEDYKNDIPNYEQEMLIIYTSGTTGVKKGAVLTQGAVCWNIYQLMKNFTWEGKIINFLPYHHVFGLVNGILLILMSGFCICINHSMKNMFKAFQIYEPQWCIVVPMIMESIEKSERRMKDRSVVGADFKGFMCGGASLKDDTFMYFYDQGISIDFGYGMTETCPVISGSKISLDKSKSSGRILKDIKVKIDDNGEVLVADKHIMKGYYKKTEETQKVVRDGWFHTGDLGYLDEDGYLFLTGRLKNLIILSNGENVSAEMLEARVSASEGVNECMVTAIDDKITAVIVPQSSSLTEEYFRTEMESWNDGLPMYQRIRDIRIRNEVFERTSSGKIVRKI